MGASDGCSSGSSVAADCAMIYRDGDASSDDTIETVYVRNSRNHLQTKLFIYSRCRTLTIRSTVVSVADVDQQLICLSDPHAVMGRQGVYM